MIVEKMVESRAARHRFMKGTLLSAATMLAFYAGIMWSHVSNGLASGFLQRSSIDPTVGLRVQF
jgi:hypothetical protein